MMQSNTEQGEERKEHNLQKGVLKSKSENDFGGAVEFTQELENKILRVLGKYFRIKIIYLQF